VLPDILALSVRKFLSVLPRFDESFPRISYRDLFAHAIAMMLKIKLVNIVWRDVRELQH